MIFGYESDLFLLKLKLSKQEEFKDYYYVRERKWAFMDIAKYMCNEFYKSKTVSDQHHL